MRGADRSLKTVTTFVQQTLVSFVKDIEPPRWSGGKSELAILRGVIRGRNLGPLFSFCHAQAQLPDELIREWQQAKMKTSLQNLAGLKITADITRIAEKTGIGTAAMRGIVLAHMLYPDPAMRPMHDIDLLIKPAARNRFLAAMKEAGHHPREFLRSQYVYVINNVTMEIHWQLLSNKRYREKFDSDLLVSSGVREETAVGHYYRLTDHWEIIGLVVHAFTHHNLGQLYSLVDIALYMRNKDIDWKEIAHISQQLGISRMMHLTLAVVNQLFRLELNNILALFRPRTGKVERFIQAYQDQAIDRITLATHLAVKQSQFYVAQTPTGKLRELLRLFSSREMRFFLDLVTARLTRRKQRLTSGHSH